MSVDEMARGKKQHSGQLLEGCKLRIDVKHLQKCFAEELSCTA